MDTIAICVENDSGLKFAGDIVRRLRDWRDDDEVAAGLQKFSEKYGLESVAIGTKSDKFSSNELSRQIFDELIHDEPIQLVELVRTLRRTTTGEVWIVWAHDWLVDDTIVSLEGTPDAFEVFIRVQNGLYRYLLDLDRDVSVIDTEHPMAWRLISND